RRSGWSGWPRRWRPEAVDLRLLEALPTEEERVAVDAVLGAPVESNGHVAEDGQEARARRDLLLPALHAANDRVGWVSPGALGYISRRLSVPPAEAYGVASFYAMLSLEEQPPTVVHVCDDIACRVNGAEDLCAGLADNLGAEDEPAMDGRATWRRSPCLGMCAAPPAVLV